MVQREVQYAVTQLPLVVGQDTTFPDYTGLHSRGAVKPLLPLSTTNPKTNDNKTSRITLAVTLCEPGLTREPILGNKPQ